MIFLWILQVWTGFKLFLELEINCNSKSHIEPISARRPSSLSNADLAWPGQHMCGPPIVGLALERVCPRHRALGSWLGAAKGEAPMAKRQWDPHDKHHQRKVHLSNKVDGPVAHHTGAAVWRRSSLVDCEVAQLWQLGLFLPLLLQQQWWWLKNCRSSSWHGRRSWCW
jgi:hypothetical protein